MKSARALLVLFSAAALARIAGACVIDLDPPLEAAPDAAGDRESEVAVPSFDVTTPPEASVDANDANDASADAACVLSTDCKSEPGAGVGCVVPKCVAGQCFYDFCPTGNACSVKTCDREAGAGACVSEQSIGFTAGQFTFPIDIPIEMLPCASGPNLSRCFAAAYPFVFAAHTRPSPSSIFAFAYPVADPTETAPAAIPVQGVDFPPANVVRGDDIVFFIGKVQAGAGSNLIPIAWLEVPRDPRATTMKATKVTLAYAPAINPAPSAFSAPDAGFFLASGTSSLLIHAPIAATKVIAPFSPLGTPSGAPVADSRDRLVLVSTSATGVVNAQIIRNAGTGGAIVTPAQNVTTVVGRAVTAQSTFGRSPAGTVVSNVARFDGGSPIAIDAVRVAWLVEPGLSFATSADAGLTIASYPGVNATVTGPIAAVDENRAVALALSPPSSTFAQLVERSDAGVLTAAATRRDAYDGGPATFSAATSNGWVYLFQSSTTAVTVRILQPSCDVP